jgi:hypothetical protein
MGRRLIHIKLDPSERILPESEAKRFRAQYDPRQTHCTCGNDLTLEDILYYVPHSDGWTIAGETEKVWLYVKCMSCGYDMSIWKMGVPRE